MTAVGGLPEKLIPLATLIPLRSVFIPSETRKLWRPDPFTVNLAPGERIVSVETIQPNPAIGAGTRVWIAGEATEVRP